MEKLPETQRESIKNMSDDRLRENLRKAGVPDVATANLDRTALQAAATGRDKPVGATVTYTDPEVEQRRLQFEEREWADEMSLRTDALPSGAPWASCLHTCASITKQYNSVYNSQWAVMPCGWKGNRRSGIALATRSVVLHLQAQ